ncbi:zinc finger MYM-type protein 1-like [Heracleum sosnowskyi]|uniref:Zinc finger MYM-type protein 1-like n=1 Tax=Heracleum sosnowskyi TaxID=360622 RepID=A0AAD8HMK2_9APIA|nr:zinc finger MYM-type protein 1-like [Heracleum sosnowskyi]
MNRYFVPVTGESSEKRARTDNNLASDDIESDPARRKPINEYDPRRRDDIRRKYVQMGPCRPLSYVFPPTQCGENMRSFQISWFHNREWLEYSISKDAAFCFWCYLFGERRAGEQAFIKNGFQNWKKAKEKFREHTGKEGSIHNNARILYFGFIDQRQSVTRKLSLGNEVVGAAYRMRLTASVDVARLLLGLGLAFRGNDETLISKRRGNFLEMLTWYGLHNTEVGKVVNKNAPGNHQLNSPDIQKQIISACASETTKAIISDIEGKYFSLLLDEARDNSVKEQMVVVIRYVNNHGEVLERFVGVVHVKDTTALSLKSSIENGSMVRSQPLVGSASSTDEEFRSPSFSQTSFFNNLKLNPFLGPPMLSHQEGLVSYYQLNISTSWRIHAYCLRNSRSIKD